MRIDNKVVWYRKYVEIKCIDSEFIIIKNNNNVGMFVQEDREKYIPCILVL